MPTLVLPPRFTDDSTILWKAAIAAGWSIERLQGWRAPADLGSRDPVLYGEPLFAAAIAEQLDLAILEPTFDWLTRLPVQYLNREVRFSTLGEGRTHHARAFFKPADDKCFPAAVYESGAALPADSIVPPATPILISEVVDWTAEFRCFVRERRLATWSPYARAGRLAEVDGEWPCTGNEAQELPEFVSTFLSDPRVALPPAVVVDVGLIAGSSWSIVEANPAWGSGIYGCSPSAVLDVLRRATVPHAALPPSDGEWVVARR